MERAFDVPLQAAESDRYVELCGVLGDSELVHHACDWLSSVAQADGAVPMAFPVSRIIHVRITGQTGPMRPGCFRPPGWSGDCVGLVSRTSWLTSAADWTWKRLESGFDEDAHTLADVLEFLANVSDQARADSVGTQVGDWLADLRWFRADAADPTYGLTPLHFAPSPDSPWHGLFDEATIDRHLDRLARDQQADGGWPITWTAPGAASALEWRGIETLRALRTLAAYGRL